MAWRKPCQELILQPQAEGEPMQGLGAAGRGAAGWLWVLPGWGWGNTGCQVLPCYHAWSCSVP